MNEAPQIMNVEKKTLRSDIPFLNRSMGYMAPSSEDCRIVRFGRGSSLTGGEIAGCDHLIIEGTMQNAALSARRIDVPEGGLLSGTAEAESATIAGRVEGKLTVSGRLIVESTGHISGDVAYGIIEIKGGGRVEGKASAIAAPVVETPARTAPKPEARPPANVEKLFDARKEDGDAETPRHRVFRRAG